MKNFLEYYYNLLNITIHDKGGTYFFTNENNNYMFVPTIRNIEEINAIYKIKNLEKYHKIVLNRNNSCITILNNRNYVLLRLNNITGSINKNDLIKKEVNMTKELSSLLRDNWINLIERKIDYIEYQRTHLNKKYHILDSSLDYYLGLAENSISYVNNTIMTQQKNYLDNLVISHRRINNMDKFSYYNPLDIIIDHPARDISGYLKKLFLQDKYDINTLNDLFNSLSLSKYGYQLFFGRMLYPSFYFDLYEQIINKRVTEKEITSIIKRQQEYENYLNTIYFLINKKVKIPSIDWI